MNMKYTVVMPKKLNKTIRLMPERAQDVLHNLILDIENSGPVQPKYPNYCKLSPNTYHCHLLYKWVAVWRCEKNTFIVEVEYVGSRENAPY